MTPVMRRRVFSACETPSAAQTPAIKPARYSGWNPALSSTPLVAPHVSSRTDPRCTRRGAWYGRRVPALSEGFCPASATASSAVFGSSVRASVIAKLLAFAPSRLSPRVTVASAYLNVHHECDPKSGPKPPSYSMDLYAAE